MTKLDASGLRRRPRLHRARSTAGFSLLELLVILAVVGLIAAIAIPFTKTLVLRSKMETTAEGIRNTLARARSDAVRLGQPVTITVDLVDHELTTTNAAGDVLARFQLPTAQADEGKVLFWGAVDDVPAAANAVVGFTDDKVVFGSDGAAAETGAIRFGMGPHPRSGAPESDHERNFLEVALTVAATPRLVTRKWVPASAAYEEKTSSGSGTNWEWY